MQKIALLGTAVWITVGFSGCSDHKTGEQATNSVSQIQADVLPKGQPALELPSETGSYRRDSTIALGGRQPDNHPEESGSSRKDSKEISFSRKYANLLMFHVQDTMEVEKPKLATLVLSRNGSVNRLKIDVLENENPDADELKTDTTMEFGSKMKARLIQFGGTDADRSFTIEAMGDDVQSFSKARNQVIWQWKVTPLKEGQQELKLSVQVLEKDDEAVSLPARTIPIIIYAKNETVMQRIGSFFERKWEFVVTAILIPVLIAVVTAGIRNKPDMRNKKTPH